MGVICDVYTLGLEDWYPEKRYDLIWTQEAVMNLIVSALQLGFHKTFKLLSVRFYGLRPKV